MFRYADHDPTRLHRVESEYETRIVLAHFADDQYKASDRALSATEKMLKATCTELDGLESAHPAPSKKKKADLGVRDTTPALSTSKR